MPVNQWGIVNEVESLDSFGLGCNPMDCTCTMDWDSFVMKVWKTAKGNTAITYPRFDHIGNLTVFSAFDIRRWGLSYKRYSLVLSEDTTTPYSILHVGPFEFFIRPKSIIF